MDLSFFSFPNQSIAGIFWATLFTFLAPFCTSGKRRLQPIIVIIAAFPLALLIFSGSRAGCLGIIVAGCYYFKIPVRLWLMPVIFIFLFCLFLKADSSLGRLHIYSLSIKMLGNHWQTGIGIGKFKALFNLYQADYFSRHAIDNRTALLADDTFYAFNDGLQWIIETGIAGFAILLLVFLMVIKRIRLLHTASPSVIISSATAGLLCIGTASLFSYPLHIWQIQLAALICFAILWFQKTAQPGFMVWTARLMLLAVMVLFMNNIICTASMERLRQKTFHSLLTGNKSEAFAMYQQLTSGNCPDGHDYYVLAEQYYYRHQPEIALLTIREGLHYYCDHRCYLLKGKIEAELKRIPAAETSLCKALYMVPNRMSSRVELLNFYIGQKDTANAVYWARSILNMPVKIPSERTNILLTETKKKLEWLQR